MSDSSVTLHEIHSQPRWWQDSLAYLTGHQGWEAIRALAAGEVHWLLIGCGSSYCLASSAAAAFREILKAPATAIPASELLLFPGQTLPAGAGRRTVPILISRSGHTSEVLRAGEILRARQIPWIGLTCDGNELAEQADISLRLPVEEKSTVMTASFTSMLLALQFIAVRLSGDGALLAHFAKLPSRLATLLEDDSARIERLMTADFDDFVFLGQGGLFAVAQECAIKVTEASQSYVQSYHTLEFRHGPKSIVSPKVLTTLLISESGYTDEAAVAEEIKGMGGAVVVIANELTPTLAAAADLAIALHLDVPESIRPAVYAVWGQLLGVFRGLHKGLNPDQPINLSRVVVL